MKIEAYVDIPEGTAGPDPWDDDFAATLPLDHVICYDENGAPHRVRELVWPWTGYHPHKKRSLLHFRYWKTTEDRAATKPSGITPAREARIREIQHLMVLVIYFNTGFTENGFGSLNRKLRCLHLLARFAESKGCTVRNVLEQPLIDIFIGTLSNLNAISWLTWLIFLGKLDSTRQLGFLLARPKHLQELRQRAQDTRDNSKQYAPLPTRIYAELINNLREEVEDIETHADRLLLTIQEARQLYHAAKKSQPSNNADFGPELIERNGLTLFFKRRELDPGLRGLPSAVNEIFLICKTLIHVFSGMRSEEAHTLPFHCMVTEKAEHGRTHCLIAGITTKLEGSRRRCTKWVTTENEGFRAIRLAQRFASAIYDGIGITPSLSEQSRDDTPLFPSTSYVPWMINRRGITVGKITLSGLHFSRCRPSFISRLFPCIEDIDIEELEEIDPFRSWREEPDFAVGKHWPLTTHQLRRSLALYANASGLVRISTLRRQLQHLTHEMSLYYGRGSTFCKNFIAEDMEGYKKHIAPEWQDGNEEAKVLSFTLDVLNSKEPLFGGAGNYFQRQSDRGEIMSREDVHKQFKAGLLNFNEGPLGGCTKPGLCTTRKGLNLVDVACATDNCKHLVGKHSRIIQVIRLKRAAMIHIDPNSINYAMEKEEIESLEKVEVTWRPSTSTQGLSDGVVHV